MKDRVKRAKSQVSRTNPTMLFVLLRKTISEAFLSSFVFAQTFRKTTNVKSIRNHLICFEDHHSARHRITKYETSCNKLEIEKEKEKKGITHNNVLLFPHIFLFQIFKFPITLHVPTYHIAPVSSFKPLN